MDINFRLCDYDSLRSSTFPFSFRAEITRQSSFLSYLLMLFFKKNHFYWHNYQIFAISYISIVWKNNLSKLYFLYLHFLLLQKKYFPQVFISYCLKKMRPPVSIIFFQIYIFLVFLAKTFKVSNSNTGKLQATLITSFVISLFTM